MFKNIVPIEDRVLVRIEPPKKQTAGGILIPDTAQEKQTIGDVLSVGPGRTLDCGKLVKPQVAKGDRILFARFGGCEVPGDETLLILRAADITAKVE